jgi:peptidoglycan/xylan/chitin deacetylase (PgdA/CDA1 family)
MKLIAGTFMAAGGSRAATPLPAGDEGTMRKGGKVKRRSVRNMVANRLIRSVMLGGLLIAVLVPGVLVLGGLVFGGFAPASAAECPGNPDALGTSRTLVVDPTEHPKLGAMQYRESLPLEDHEIVITFDDGPLPPRTTQVLDTLDHECVKVTFFLIGKMAHAYPETVRRIRAAGHTIGTHSYSHPLTFHRMPIERAQFEITQGIAQVKAALGEGDDGPAPFFRIPGLLRADGVERYAASQNLQVWSTDFLADDWTKIGPAQVYSRALQRIEAAHKGILLLHDIQPRTVEALPYLLRELKRRGYKIVQVVPATSDQPKTVTDPGLWAIHPRQISRTPIFIETEPELPAPSPASFGIDVGLNSVSFFHKISFARDPSWQPLARPAPPPPAPVSVWPDGSDMTRGMPNMSGQFHLPATDLRHADSARAWSPVSTMHAGSEAGGVVAVNEIQHLIESLPDEAAPAADDAPAGQGATPRGRGPAANAAIPRGAFP